jgi:very-short-patch-repair endonuclease
MEMIQKIKSIHGDKYRFDKFEYNSYKNKVVLICENHGDFNISIGNLVGNKRGCPKCGIERGKNSCRSNTFDFIKKSKIIHAEKYEYKKVEYFNWKTKVIITCKIHGDFQQIPNVHLRGSGCKKCMNRKKKKIVKTKEDKVLEKQNNFINRCNKIHLFKYDYSLVVFKATNIKVKIICNKHGIFEQKPLHHLRGSGCSVCSKENQFGRCRLSTQDFILESKKRHLDYYDYSVSEYNGSKNKIKISCPKHGIFEQNPRYHINGGGCPKCKCGSGKLGDYSFTNDEFIDLCNIANDFKYDYSKTLFKGTKNKITVICKNHSEFEIQAYNHKNGIGCLKCSIDNKSLNKQAFLLKANTIHNNKYIYDNLSEFIKGKERISIMCKEHGEFKQQVEVHLSGSGCTLCKTKSRGEIRIKEFLENNNIKYIKEKTFYETNRLRFDFYLKDMNICIEYDGKHHFKPIKYFGGMDAFIKTQQHDEIKNLFCKSNGIDIIRIPYTQLKNIEKILKNKLLENVKLQT